MILEGQGSGFWHADMGQVLVAAIVGAAWVVNKAIDWAGLRQEMRSVKAQMEKHFEEAKKRDELIGKLGETSVKLTTMIEGQEYRIRNLERR